MVGKIWALFVLLLRFLKAVVLSGWQTVQVILATTPGGEPARTGTFVRVRFAPMNATGAALLAAACARRDRRAGDGRWHPHRV
jgi:hypothetical protein